MSDPPRRLPVEQTYLRDLFSRNASTYDPVNRLISLGQVSLWRRTVIRLARLSPSDRVLDAFAGPGSLGVLAARRLGPGGEVVFADLSPVMLAQARRRYREACRSRRTPGACPAARFLVADATALAGAGEFDALLLGFALRYVADPGEALASLAGHLRPGGRLAVLEFTGPGTKTGVTQAGARFYFHRLLPAVAARLSPGREVYDYLSASTQAFLSAEELRTAVENVGLRVTEMRLAAAGLVCLLGAEKPRQEPAPG